MTELMLRFFMHMGLSRGGSVYGYEILDAAGNVIGTKSKSRAKGKDPFDITYRLGEREFSTADEFKTAYEKQVETARRDKEWEDAAP